MFVIFLDFDGVIITPESRAKSRFPEADPNHKSVIDKELLGNVEELRRAKNAKIVITSYWRCYRTLHAIRELLDIIPPEYIIGKTPVDPENLNRGTEISLYLEAHPEVQNYIILDDDTNVSIPKLKEHWVECDYNEGFIKPKLEVALGKKFKTVL